jgi:hypothetical protein
MTTYLILVEDVFIIHCCNSRKENIEKEYNTKVMRTFPKESDIDVRHWHCGLQPCIKGV